MSLRNQRRSAAIGGVIGAAIGIFVLAIVFIALWALAVIWALNTLFALGIAYSFWNWLVVTVLLIAIKGSYGNSSKGN